MGKLIQDLRYGIRMLAKNPSFSGVLVLVLGLGIGGTTAMFTVTDRVLLRPLPFPHPEQLMAVSGLTYPSRIDPLDWWGHNQAFDQLASCASGGVNLGGGGRAERVSAAVVSASFFPVLQVRPILGRAFLLEEEKSARDQVAVLSYGLWVESFGKDPGVLGRTVRLNGVPHTVVGVMPRGFIFPGLTEVWVPRGPAFLGEHPFNLLSSASGLSASGLPRAFGRLRPGVMPQQADAVMTALAHRLQEKYGSERYTVAAKRVSVHPLQETMVRDARRGLLTLFVAVCFVLLIVCANAASMLLARAVVRRKEVAIRLCLGASRWRVAYQLLTESVLLAMAAGAVGALIALWGVEGIRAISPADIPRLAEVRVDPVVLGFALAVSLLTGVLVGFAPALQASTASLTEVLKAEGLRSTGGLGERMRAALVVGEVALALVLLSGAGLMIRTFARLSRVEPGFDPRNVLTMELALPAAKYRAPSKLQPSSVPPETTRGNPEGALTEKPEIEQEVGAEKTEPGKPDDAKIVSFHQRLQESIRSLPGVVAVGATTDLPLGGEVGGYLFFDMSGKLSVGEARVSVVSGDYFRALGNPLLAGRAFTWRDTRQTPQVVVINQTFARSFWGDKSPVGEQFVIEGERNPREVVGVVGDVKAGGLGEAPEPQMYLPYAQPYSNYGKPSLDMTLVVRTASDPRSMAESLRRRVLASDEDLPVFHVRTMEEVISGSAAPERFRGLLLGIFASLALVLAVLGVYGVVSYSVATRTHEMGIRMSMGAEPRDILRLVFAQGMRLALLGIGAGLVGALGLNRLISGFLFGVTPSDPTTIAGAALLLVGGALLACSVPARRATRVAPMEALRYE